MKRVHIKVTVNGKVLPLVHDAVIREGRNQFTDTAVIRLPNRITDSGKKISDFIPLGAEVKIEIGYYPDLFTQFGGYVSQVIPERMASVKCENEMYTLKRQNIGKDIIQKNTTTKRMIEAIYSGELEVNETNIGDFTASASATVVDVLAELQSNYRIYSYFRGKTLVVGAENDSRQKREIKCSFQENVPSGESNYNIKDSTADEIAVKVSKVGRDGVVMNVFAYYDNTNNIIYSTESPFNKSVNEFNIGGGSDMSDSDMKALAKRRLEALSFTGVDGSVTIYGTEGNEGARHGDTAVVTDLAVPEKNGKFAIVEVVKRAGVNIGYRQDLILGISV